MLRIIRCTTNRSLGPQETMQALEAAQAVAQAAEKVPGVKSCTLYLGQGALIFAAESDGYASADKTLADAGVQGTFGRLGAEFGYFVSGDEFLLDPSLIYPFLQR